MEMHQLKQLRHRIGFCECEHLSLSLHRRASIRGCEHLRQLLGMLYPLHAEPETPWHLIATEERESMSIQSHASQQVEDGPQSMDALNLNLSCKGQLC